MGTDKLITAIHSCNLDGGVYVEHDGKWYCVITKGMVNAFVEIKNWNDAYWQGHQKDCPCMSSSKKAG